MILWHSDRNGRLNLEKREAWKTKNLALTRSVLQDGGKSDFLTQTLLWSVIESVRTLSHKKKQTFSLHQVLKKNQASDLISNHIKVNFTAHYCKQTDRRNLRGGLEQTWAFRSVVFTVTHSQVEKKWNFFLFPDQLIVFGSINPDYNTKEKESEKI